jgi:hypothetical protein
MSNSSSSNGNGNLEVVKVISRAFCLGSNIQLLPERFAGVLQDADNKRTFVGHAEQISNQFPAVASPLLSGRYPDL